MVGDLSNKTSDKWFSLCNKTHVNRLISIIKPKVVIPIGNKSLYGLKFCGQL